MVRHFVPWFGETGWKPILHWARASSRRGRQIERPNNAETGSDGPICTTSHVRTLILHGHRCEVHLVPAPLGPPGRTVYY